VSIEPYLFNVKTAAEYLGVAERTIEAWIALGKFRLVKLPNPDGDGFGRRRLIHRDELQRFVREEERES
jgi:excisionase family DNA binding protein